MSLHICYTPHIQSTCSYIIYYKFIHCYVLQNKVFVKNLSLS